MAKQTTPAATRQRPPVARPAAAKPAAAKPAADDRAIPDMFVMDTTALPGVSRTHELIVNKVARPFTFEYATPLKLPAAIALRFLKHDAFQLTDAEGSRREYVRRPRQPEELQAGEQLELGEDECVARYDELSTVALQARVLELQGSERFAHAADREKMIEFIKRAKAEEMAKRRAPEDDVGSDEFVPEAEADDDMSEAA